MGKFAALLLAFAVGAGCYADTYGGAYVAAPAPYATVNYGTPVPEYNEADVYYEPRDGYDYVNGRYNWVNGAWAWSPGYYQPVRPGYVYIQGYWAGNRWYDGRYEAHRPGYVYTGGYWDRGQRGHVWRNGSWERERPGQTYVRGGWSTNGGARSYNRGSWAPAASRVRDHRNR